MKFIVLKEVTPQNQPRRELSSLGSVTKRLHEHGAPVITVIQIVAWLEGNCSPSRGLQSIILISKLMLLLQDSIYFLKFL